MRFNTEKDVYEMLKKYRFANCLLTSSGIVKWSKFNFKNGHDVLYFDNEKKVFEIYRDNDRLYADEVLQGKECELKTVVKELIDDGYMLL